MRRKHAGWPNWRGDQRALVAALVVVLSPAVAAAAQVEGPTIKIPCKWEPGETLELEAVSERWQLVEGRWMRQARSRAEIGIEVLSRGSEGWTLAWTWGDTEMLDEPGAAVDPRVKRWAKELLSAQRGTRLDENTPGHGIGLAVVKELAESYGGALEIGRSDLGGAQFTITIP